MTQEGKELLLKDLCSRLPYNVFIAIMADNGEMMKDILRPYALNIFNGRDEIKPYLRPMSSMTEEEENEFISLNAVPSPCQLPNHTRMSWYSNATMLDWLNEHHFDYRNLIRKGLALEAPEGMYKIK